MRLQEGKHYKTRDGRIVGPIKRIADTSWPFWIPNMNFHPYRADGNASLSGWIESKDDLIEEIDLTYRVPSL